MASLSGILLVIGLATALLGYVPLLIARITDVGPGANLADEKAIFLAAVLVGGFFSAMGLRMGGRQSARLHR